MAASIASRTLLAAAIAMASLPAANAASEPKLLAQVGPWDMNYDNDGCTLLGSFGTGGDNIVMELTRFSPGDSFTLAFVGYPVASSMPRANVTVGFGPPPTARKVSAIPGRSGDKSLVRLSGSFRLDGREGPKEGEKASDLPPVQPNVEAAIRWLDLVTPNGRRLRLDLGPMDRPMAAVRSCTDDLVRSWGLDPVVQAKLSRWAKPLCSPASWITDDDYPTGPLRAGTQSIVEFRLKIDESGKVATCAIQRATQGPEFQALTCKLITERARFAPALDASGKPVASFYRNIVRFVIP